MSIPASNFLRCLGGLLLLAGVTWIVETLALLAAYHGQIIPPYAFFPNQLYDFLAKLRWLANELPWLAPPLPDRFTGLGIGDKVRYAAGLLPVLASMTLVLGIAAGAVAALTQRRMRSLRSYVLFWSVVALLVHVGMSIPALGIESGMRMSQIAYRARSLVVDGALLAIAVAIVAGAAAAWMAPQFEGRGRRLRRYAAVSAFECAAIAAFILSSAVPATRASAAPAQLSAPVATGDRYNVVLISLDSLRADHLSTYGYERETSPNITRLARSGVLFRNAIATSSWTLPTHLTMFTGRYQISHGVVEDTRVLLPSIPTLGQIFKASGYATAGYVSGPYVAGHYGYSRGMDTYVDFSEDVGKGREAREQITSPSINEQALAWLDQRTDQEPFFLFLHYFDIHYDYIPPAPYDRMFDPDYTGTMDGRNFIERKDVHPKMDPRDLAHIIALYDGEIRFTDHHVGAILDKLDQKGFSGNTVILLTADHGEEFFEHGNKGHHRTVYEEVLRVPFVLRIPGGAHAGKEVDEQVSLVDVFPTLLDLAGLPPSPDVEGISVRALAEGNRSDRDAVYAEFFDKLGLNLQVARRTPAAKTIEHFNRITHPRRSPIEYYDLKDDPEERDDRAADNPGAVHAELSSLSQWLETQWRAQRNAEAAAGGRASIDIDDETMERLKSLGYVGD
ncbi:MAG TPA: sulfatase [Candidatus Limnocylindrales bacterium]|nr:sulfatase [Candidatus Limnocylindrales bacterium]